MSASVGRYMNLEKDLTGICSAAGLDGPVICPYDWRQTVEYIAESWVAPRIWQRVGDKKKVRRAHVVTGCPGDNRASCVGQSPASQFQLCPDTCL